MIYFDIDNHLIISYTFFYNLLMTRYSLTSRNKKKNHQVKMNQRDLNDFLETINFKLPPIKKFKSI